MDVGDLKEEEGGRKEGKRRIKGNEITDRLMREERWKKVRCDCIGRGSAGNDS
jgi:hypothetical protein